MTPIGDVLPFRNLPANVRFRDLIDPTEFSRNFTCASPFFLMLQNTPQIPPNSLSGD